MLGEHQRAADCGDRALRGFGVEGPRVVQLNRIYRTQALLGLDELDEALSLGRSAAPIANQLTSARVVESVKAFDSELEPYAAEPQVREWRDYLRTELQTAA